MKIMIFPNFNKMIQNCFLQTFRFFVVAIITNSFQIWKYKDNVRMMADFYDLCNLKVDIDLIHHGFRNAYFVLKS